MKEQNTEIKEKGKGPLRVALAGNPNSGKTTLFNALTGSNQYVGNWPGVTVEKKEGRLKGHENVIIQDLPGIYSLSPYTLEERIARDFLVDEKPDIILNIIDGTNLERNLYLSTQLSELDVPVLGAINMMDLVKKNQDEINIKALGEALSFPLVPISALEKTGVEECVRMIFNLAEKKEEAKIQKTSPQKPTVTFPEPIEMAIKEMEDLLTEAPENGRRWYAIKAFENDEIAMKRLNLPVFKKKDLALIREKIEKEEEDDAESIISACRYEAIGEILHKAYKKKKQAMTLSDKIDRIVTHRILGIPIFVGVCFLMFYLSISGLGVAMTDFVNDTVVADTIQPAVASFLQGIGASEVLISLVVDGIIGGIGAPVGFLPQMAMVFLFLGFLEDCGYMARVAFIMDRIFRRFGLSGKSFLSFLVSTGCGVPGIMATRTIENEKDRRMTMIGTCMVPCSAKLPIIALVAGYIIGGAWWVAPVVYLSSMVMIIVTCIILKKLSFFAGDPAPFIMELPAYHIPRISGVLRQVWFRLKSFLRKAGTIIFLMCVTMWFLAQFGFEGGSFGMVEDASESLIAVMGQKIAWIFTPLGFGNWQSVASSIAGFTAKEGVVSTMGILANVGAIDAYEPTMHGAFQAFFPTSLVAVSFLFFNLFNSPCLAAVSALHSEVGDRGLFWKIILFQNVYSYAVALIVYQLGGLVLGKVPFSPLTILALGVLAILLFLLFRPDPSKKRAEAGRAGAAYDYQ